MKGIYEVKTKNRWGTYATRLSAGGFDDAADKVMTLAKCHRQCIKSVKFIRGI